jgi:hypothetical protein
VVQTGETSGTVVVSSDGSASSGHSTEQTQCCGGEMLKLMS